MSASGYFTNRQLPGNRAGSESSLELSTSGQQKAADVRNADCTLAWTRARQRGSLDELQLLEAAVPHGSQIGHGDRRAS